MKAPPGTAPPAGNPCATCRNMKNIVEHFYDPEDQGSREKTRP